MYIRRRGGWVIHPLLLMQVSINKSRTATLVFYLLKPRHVAVWVSSTNLSARCHRHVVNGVQRIPISDEVATAVLVHLEVVLACNRVQLLYGGVLRRCLRVKRWSKAD